MCVLTSAMHMLKNVVNTAKWTIVSSVQRHVEDVRKSVAKYLDSQQVLTKGRPALFKRVSLISS
jgi:predicted nucleic acid-binding protein